MPKNQQQIDKEVEKRGPVRMTGVSNNAPGGVSGNLNRQDRTIDGEEFKKGEMGMQHSGKRTFKGITHHGD